VDCENIKKWKTDLSLIRRMHAQGIMSDEVAYCYKALTIIFIAEEVLLSMVNDSNSALNSIIKKIEDIKHKNGLGNDEVWSSEKVPEEYNKLTIEFDKICHQITANFLRTLGGHKMGQEFEKSPNEFYKQFEVLKSFQFNYTEPRRDG